MPCYTITRSEPRGRYHYVVAEFWRSARDRRRGRPPFLINDFKLHQRTAGQRICTDDRGRFLHASGAAVPPADVAAFTAALPSGHHWDRDDHGRIRRDRRGEWIRRDGRRAAPCLLGGHEHDPDWRREPITRPMAAIVADEMTAYLARAVAHGWEGDRRGTTTVYQVDAGGNDGTVTGGDVLDDTAGNLTVGNDGDAYHAWYRFTGVSGLAAGVTVNSAILSVHGFDGDTGSPLTNLYFDPSAAPTNPTSLANYQARLSGDYVGWSPPNLTTGLWEDSPELATLVQAVVDGVGGGGPSALLVLHTDGASSGGEFSSPYAYDGNATLAAKLTLDTSGGPAPPLPSHRQPRPIYGR